MDIANYIRMNTPNRDDKEPIYIFWTGGWDSSFRILELSRNDCLVQPIYVVDPNRKSVPYEIASMNKITELLRKNENTKALISDLITIERYDIPEDDSISYAYEVIHKRTNLGSQHEWLARLGKLFPGIEMGTEAGEPETSHIIDALQTFCCLEVEDNIGHVNHEKSSQEGNLVLGWFTYPIITRHETDMVDQVKKWGYEEIMKNVWFCHSPIKGKPCGFCHPCAVKMESNMEMLLPQESQKHYYYSMKIQKIFGEKAASAYSHLIRGMVK